MPHVSPGDRQVFQSEVFLLSVCLSAHYSYMCWPAGTKVLWHTDESHDLDHYVSVLRANPLTTPSFSDEQTNELVRKQQYPTPQCCKQFLSSYYHSLCGVGCHNCRSYIIATLPHRIVENTGTDDTAQAGLLQRYQPM